MLYITHTLCPLCMGWGVLNITHNVVLLYISGYEWTWLLCIYVLLISLLEWYNASRSGDEWLCAVWKMTSEEDNAEVNIIADKYQPTSIQVRWCTYKPVDIVNTSI